MADYAQTHRIEARFYGDRNYPVATAVIPRAQLADFEALLRDAQVRYPNFTHEHLLRYVWSKGLTAFRTAVVSKHPPNPLSRQFQLPVTK